MQDYDGVVGIYSKNNSLSEKLKDKFEQKYLEVKIFDDFLKVDLSKLSYLIINLIDFKSELLNVQRYLKGVDCKILLIHPLVVKSSEKFVIDTELQNLLNLNNNLGVLLVPDVLGKNLDFNPLYLSHDLIMQSILSERVKIDSSSQLINTISVNKLAERIVKDTFSFGISSQIVSLIGPRKSKRAFVKKYLGVKDENIINTKAEVDRVELYSTASALVDFSLNLAVKNTIESISSKTGTKVEESLIPEEVKTERKRDNNIIKLKLLRLYKILLFLLALCTLPIFIIFLSGGLLFLASKTVFTNNGLSNKLITQSRNLSHFTKSISFGNNFLYDSSNIIYEISSLGLEGSILVKSGQQFVNQIMADEPYDLPFYASNISASLDKIHTDLSFLQSDVNDLNGFVGNIIKNSLAKRKIDLGEYKNKIYYVKNLFSRASIILGAESPKKYLILFQNNMELRPTGGFIGSFGLVTFDKGRMSEIVVNDVYMADGQLKGHVDPPEPIRKYLGEGGWYLRDSNWDPNFPISAEKAEWFLEKEIGVNVDGVISMDLNFIRRLLKVIGPISLNDFNIVITADNLYETIQNEVENDFFPGSIKKATILTSLTKSLIFEVQHLSPDKYLGFFRELYESLERKHIQVYLHDTNANESISMLKYDGSFSLDTECGPRCFSDSYSLIDANLGVNKSNYYIKRSHEINLSISKDLIGHELLVTYENTANPAVGNMGVYKNYARVLLPIGSEVGGVRLYDLNGEHKELEYELLDTDGRRELGFIFEVLPSTQKKLQIVWNIKDKKLEQGGQYNLNVLKQSGTDEDQLDVNIRSTDLTLTGKAPSSYNTNLAKDFTVRMFFKPQL